MRPLIGFILQTGIVLMVLLLPFALKVLVPKALIAMEPLFSATSCRAMCLQFAISMAVVVVALYVLINYGWFILSILLHVFMMGMSYGLGMQ